MSGPLIRTVRCPLCQNLPDLVIGPTQAFCGNEDCRVFMFDPSADAAEQIANHTELQIDLVRDGGLAPAVAVPQVRGSAADDIREAEIREFFHRSGWSCADGCQVCGSPG